MVEVVKEMWVLWLLRDVDYREVLILWSLRY